MSVSLLTGRNLFPEAAPLDHMLTPCRRGEWWRVKHHVSKVSMVTVISVAWAAVTDS